MLLATEFTEDTEPILMEKLFTPLRIQSAQLLKSAGKANNYLFVSAFRDFRGYELGRI